MDGENASTPATREDHDWKYGLATMAWHGWGSPVGLGLFVLLVAGAASLLKVAVFG